MYKPPLGNLQYGERFSNAQVREFSKYYDTFFDMAPQRKRDLATRLGVPAFNLANWMYRRRCKLQAKQLTRLPSSVLQDHVTTTGICILYFCHTVDLEIFV